MRVLFDNGVPRGVASVLEGHIVEEARDRGWDRLKNGDLLDALYVSEDKDAIVVRMPGTEDRRIPRADVRNTKYLRRSLMPEGLLESMTDQQVTDLLTYLKSLTGS